MPLLARARARPAPGARRRTLWLALAASPLALLAAAAAFIRAALVLVTVENQSMAPTLQPGDRVLVLRHWPQRWLRRGQIVIVWPWERPAGGPAPFGVETPYIKRITGMPGDTISASLDELDPVNRQREAAAYGPDGRRSWRVPPGHCFVRGDHPIGGFDSLAWGPVPLRCVLGVALVRRPRRAGQS